jgi:hypothetical protein
MLIHYVNLNSCIMPFFPNFMFIFLILQTCFFINEDIYLGFKWPQLTLFLYKILSKCENFKVMILTKIKIN